MQNPSEIRAQDVEDLTREVLTRPEFQQSDESDVGLMITELIIDLLEGLTRWAAANPLAAEILSWLLIVLIILLLGYAASKFIGVFLRTRPPTLDVALESSSSWQTLEGRADDWEGALLKARRALGEGRIYEALWLAHRALLALLDYRKQIQFAAWKTNRDYLREYTEPDSGGEILRAVTDAYESVVYAHRPVPGARIEELLKQIDAEKAGSG